MKRMLSTLGALALILSAAEADEIVNRLVPLVREFLATPAKP